VSPTTTFADYSDYIHACELSCPDPFPDSFARYQAGAWYAEGKFTISNSNTLPLRQQDPDFWAGYNSIIP